MTPNVQRHNCSIYLGSWRRSEKQATFTLTENLWLHGNQRVVGWFFRGWAVRFMFRARPFVIMAECKQTDIIWRLLHHYQDLPLLHVQNWQKKAPEEGRKILFCYWCFLLMLVSFRPIQNNIIVKIYDGLGNHFFVLKTPKNAMKHIILSFKKKGRCYIWPFWGATVFQKDSLDTWHFES